MNMQGSTNFRQTLHPTKESKLRDRMCEIKYGGYKPPMEHYTQAILKRIVKHLKQSGDTQSVESLQPLIKSTQDSLANDADYRYWLSI